MTTQRFTKSVGGICQVLRPDGLRLHRYLPSGRATHEHQFGDFSETFQKRPAKDPQERPLSD